MPQKLNNEGLLKVLGLMSGTSLDGLDLCLVEFSAKHRTQFQILASATYSYSKAWQEKLSFKQLSAWELSNLDYQYSLLLAQYVLRFCKEHGLETAKIDLLSSHGHTWFHQAEKGITYQIGNHPSLAVETGMELACDFRRQDVALGGQGAPLVPIGDRDLFPNYDACLNLGGFANISFQEDSKRIAYDIGPCNLAMNSYCQILGLPYDNEGTIAASFKHDSALFNKLNGLGYYIQSGPKSLGREWLEETLLPLVEETPLSPEVKIATLNRHIAFQIAA
ncbi:MAG: anhydro-N-acetylmuramic acid kinase, partial [Croceimicrobium sp.]